MTNDGHGWVRPREDGAHARCGGPDICEECKAEAKLYGLKDKLAPIKAKLYLKGEPPETVDDEDETALPIGETATFSIAVSQRELLAQVFRPGDSVVITYPGELSPEQTDAMIKQLRDDMPGVNVVLLIGEVQVHKLINLPDKDDEEEVKGEDD